MDPLSYVKIESRVASLLMSRRASFPFLNNDNGRFQKRRIPLVLLNTLGSCLNIPVLFFISFYTLMVYPALEVKPLELISVLFLSVILSILCDIFIGYLFDRLSKSTANKGPNRPARNVLAILGNVGLVAALAFLFKVGVTHEDALRQFRVAIPLTVLFMVLANCGNIKHSMNYSPSQDHRKRIFQLEYLMKGLIIFLFVSIPLWAKLNTPDCACKAICVRDPANDACITCLNTCDTFTGNSLTYFRVVTIVFTCVFAVANILSLFLVTTRHDEEREEIHTSLNRRFNELFSNKFLIQGFIISLLEFTILFGFAIWAFYYVSQELSVNAACTVKYENSPYVCTKSFYLQMTVLVMFVASALTFIVTATIPYVVFLSTSVTLLTILTGVFIAIIHPDQIAVYWAVAVLMGVFFGVLAASKLIYSSGVFYDEYKSGSAQAHFPSGIFLLSIKLGFLLALAFHLTLLDPNGLGDITKNSNNQGFGVFVIIASIVIVILKVFINRNNLHAFDKIQLAIQKNTSPQNNDIAFFDPITKEPVRCPVTASHPLEKKLIRLMYNMDSDDIREVLNGKPHNVRNRAMVKMIIHAIFLVICTVIVIVLGHWFNTAWGWALMIPLVYLPIGVLAFLYAYNVWATVGFIDLSKYKDVDRDVLIKFALLLERGN